MSETRTVAAAGPTAAGVEPRVMAATEPPNDLIFHYVVEAIGTACLIFMGAAAIIMTGGHVSTVESTGCDGPTMSRNQSRLDPSPDLYSR